MLRNKSGAGGHGPTNEPAEGYSPAGLWRSDLAGALCAFVTKRRSHHIDRNRSGTRGTELRVRAAAIEGRGFQIGIGGAAIDTRGTEAAGGNCRCIRLAVIHRRGGKSRHGGEKT